MAANAPHPEEAAQFQLALQTFTEGDAAQALYQAVQALKNPGAGLGKNEANPTDTEADLTNTDLANAEAATPANVHASTLPPPPSPPPPPPPPSGPATLPPVPTIIGLPTIPNMSAAIDYPMVVQNRTPL